MSEDMQNLLIVAARVADRNGVLLANERRECSNCGALIDNDMRPHTIGCIVSIAQEMCRKFGWSFRP